MKAFVLALAACLSLAAPALAKNFAVPPANPAATIVIPDTWTTTESEYGYNAKSPDGDVLFVIESADKKSLPKMMEANEEWMKENNIRVIGKPVERDFDLGGLEASLVSYKAKDENGDTQVDFVFIPAGPNRVIMLTLWASEAEQKANAADIDAIKRSIKAIK